ncbi:MAG: TolC family protein [Gemmatimonadota bacterium]|nr:TolC family protein [Gemmatimonadota bacterium]
MAIISPDPDTLALSLADAVQLARENNPMVQMADAEARAANQNPAMASQAFLPTVTVSGQGIRTTDPVAAFGLKLRQANFQAQDLALDAMNNPAPYTGFTVGVTIQQPLFAPEGLFGHAAARRAAAAREAGVDRARGMIELETVRAYWGAQLAAGAVATWDAALVAATAHAEQAEALQAQGLVTSLDARLARLRVADLEARRIQSIADRANAVDGIRTLLGIGFDMPITLSDSIVPEVDMGCGEDCSAERQDLAAARLALSATELAVKSAWAAQLPQVGAFGVFEHNANTTSFGGSGHWTIGIGVTWNPFPALSGIGAVRRAQADRDRQFHQLSQLEATARFEKVSAERLREAAQNRVAIAERAFQESIDALGQAEVRYRTGVSSISELLDVEAAHTAARLNMLAARHDLLVADASFEFAIGAFDR